jgi:uncharacterized protein YndB with AHSA1/START domain
MTTHKTFKRRVRARSAKTGESYTAARAQLLRKAEPTDAPSEPAIDPMELTGVSDEAMVRATGKPIAEWLGILDTWGGTEHKHPEIARWLVEHHGIPGWWAQNVTVAYERARGMRAKYEEPGGFAASASKTITASAKRILEAFTDDELRSRWLSGSEIRLRTSAVRSARFDWDDPPSLVTYYLTPKDGGKTQIGLSHEKLPDAEAAERMKRFWRERLAALKELLEAG